MNVRMESMLRALARRMYVYKRLFHLRIFFFQTLDPATRTCTEMHIQIYTVFTVFKYRRVHTG
jgi:hypothetical protein